MAYQRRNVFLLVLILLALSMLCFSPSIELRLSLANSIHAEENFTTACFVLPGDDFSTKSAALLNYAARENFRQTSQIHLLEVREILNAGANDPRVKSIKKAREYLNRGKKLYNNLQLTAAIENLHEAKKEYQNAVGLVRDTAEYVDTLMTLGAAYILSGDIEDGADVFRELALFDIQTKLDPKMFLSFILDIYTRVQNEVKARPFGATMVNSNPQGAEVYVNTVFKGITPMRVTDMPYGTHFLRVEKDGYLPWGKQISFSAAYDVSANAILKQGPKLEEFVKHTNKKMFSHLNKKKKQPGEQLINFGKWINADRLFVVEAKQQKDEVMCKALLSQVNPPKRLWYKSTKIKVSASNFFTQANAFFSSLYQTEDILPVQIKQNQDDEDVFALMLSTCKTDLDCVQEEVCDKEARRCIPYSRVRGKAFYQKWWFWTIIGAVVIGGSVGAGVGVTK